MTNRLFETFCALTAIDSPSFEERSLCDALKTRLSALGVDHEEDDAGARIGGLCGNLYGYLPGARPGVPLLFSAHMDTVEPARGKTAHLHDDGSITSDGKTVLGADDVSGLSVILEAIARLRESGVPHRSIELLFSVAEERYGAGSRVANYSKFRAKQAYVLDLGGAVGEAANAAPTLLSFVVDVTGKAAHAGFAPHTGVHAIAAAAKAIARIPLGALIAPLGATQTSQRDESGLTLNVGVIQGGEADNIVPDRCRVSGEIRGLSHEAVLAQWDAVKLVFEEEAQRAGGHCECIRKIEILAYETPLHSPTARRFARACAAIGAPCRIHPTLGGSDNNHFARHGIEGLVVACSMHEVHSARESARLDEMEQCVRLVLHMMTQEDAEPGME